MSVLLAAAVLAGAVAAAYLFCVRPMRRAACPMTKMAQAAPSRHDRPAAAPAGLGAELDRTAQELAALRERAAAAGRVGSS